MRTLNWSDPGESIDPSVVESAETRLSVKFPQDYLEMITLHSGGDNPEECSFKYFSQGESWGGNFGVLLSLREEDSENVFETIEGFGDRLPQGLIPIIESGSGDLVCLDYRSSSTPTICHFSHDSPAEDAVCFVANTFSEFLDLLYNPES